MLQLFGVKRRSPKRKCKRSGPCRSPLSTRDKKTGCCRRKKNLGPSLINLQMLAESYGLDIRLKSKYPGVTPKKLTKTGLKARLTKAGVDYKAAFSGLYLGLKTMPIRPVVSRDFAPFGGEPATQAGISDLQASVAKARQDEFIRKRAANTIGNAALTRQWDNKKAAEAKAARAKTLSNARAKMQAAVKAQGKLSQASRQTAALNAAKLRAAEGGVVPREVARIESNSSVARRADERFAALAQRFPQATEEELTMVFGKKRKQKKCKKSQYRFQGRCRSRALRPCKNAGYTRSPKTYKCGGWKVTLLELQSIARASGVPTTKVLRIDKQGNKLYGKSPIKATALKTRLTRAGVSYPSGPYLSGGSSAPVRSSRKSLSPAERGRLRGGGPEASELDSYRSEAGFSALFGRMGR